MPSPSMIAMYDEEHDVLRKQSARKHDDDGGADLTREFFYLAGPMSNLPNLNFPRFHELAGILRDNDYNICNPAEFDHEIAKFVMSQPEGSHKQLSAAMASEGLYAPTWAECLRRDIEYVGDPNCVGVICMEGWQHSQGAQFETYVAYKLLKPIYELTITDAGPQLRQINRREELDAAGVVD